MPAPDVKMQSAPRHLSTDELERLLPSVLDSPRDQGRLEAIFVRPSANKRRALKTAQLSCERGIEGDRWFAESRKQLDDGRPDPRNQVSLMNFRFLRQLAVTEDAMCLAGDNLIVDFDLSDESLPPGSRIAIAGVCLELSDLPHIGCARLQRRFGRAAKTFVNDSRHRALNLCGRYAQVVTGGSISVGDSIQKLPRTRAQ